MSERELESRERRAGETRERERRDESPWEKERESSPCLKVSQIIATEGKNFLNILLLRRKVFFHYIVPCEIYFKAKHPGNPVKSPSTFFLKGRDSNRSNTRKIKTSFSLYLRLREHDREKCYFLGVTIGRTCRRTWEIGGDSAASCDGGKESLSTTISDSTPFKVRWKKSAFARA